MTVLQTLKQADIFYELSHTQLELIASISHTRMYPPGEIIFEENSVGEELFVIASGEVEIQVSSALVERPGSTPPTVQTIATLRRGQSFGEVALVDEGVRSARARCADAAEAEIIVIPRDKLMLLCDTYPHLGYRLMRNLAADLAMKIRVTDLQVREYLSWMRKR